MAKPNRLSEEITKVARSVATDLRHITNWTATDALNMAFGNVAPQEPWTPAIRYERPLRERVLHDEPTVNEHLASNNDEVAEGRRMSVRLLSDGTTTTAEIIDSLDGAVIGEGVARRRKGERRNEALGVAIATARAFRDAADEYAEVAEMMLNGGS